MQKNKNVCNEKENVANIVVHNLLLYRLFIEEFQVFQVLQVSKVSDE